LAKILAGRFLCRLGLCGLDGFLLADFFMVSFRSFVLLAASAAMSRIHDHMPGVSFPCPAIDGRAGEALRAAAIAGE
jgi:hypothetical protein